MVSDGIKNLEEIEENDLKIFLRGPLKIHIFRRDQTDG
jgi:hypothetical protein